MWNVEGLAQREEKSTGAKSEVKPTLELSAEKSDGIYNAYSRTILLQNRKRTISYSIIE